MPLKENGQGRRQNMMSSTKQIKPAIDMSAALPVRNSSVVIMPSMIEFAEGLAGVMREGYGYTIEEEAIFADSIPADKFRSHLQVFPEGQWMALETADNNRPVGITASMRIDFDPTHPFLEPWEKATNFGSITTHNPNSEWLYGVESCVVPEYRSLGIGGKFIGLRFDLARRLNLRGMVAGSAIIDYHKVADTMPVDEYVQNIIDGKLWDTNLSKQLKKGFRAVALNENYVTDPTTRGWGVTILWDNPDYRPMNSIFVPKRMPSLTRDIKPVRISA
ncbi:MAG: hypothetical protein H7175_28825 [Burkholderiales bacterium]|nr:hypothetical protein [Anaerolineae bacterium]